MRTIELELTAPIIVAVATFVLILLHIFLRISTVRKDMTMFYDGSNSLNFRHQYLIRLLYDAKSTSYNDALTTIYVQLDHSINRVVKIPFEASTMSRVFMYKGHRCAKVFIRTCDKYHDVRCATIYHNGMGSILVHSIELQDIKQPNVIVAAIGQPIYGANSNKPGNIMQSYPFGIERPNVIEDDIKPSCNVTLSETIIFFYTATNMIYLVDLWLLQQCCTAGKFCALTKAFGFGFAGGLIGFVLFLLIIAPFRYFFKVYFHQKIGRGLSKFLRLVYLMFAVSVGVVFGAFASDLSLNQYYSDINKDGRILSAPHLWLITSVFSVFCLFCLIGISIPLAIYIKFIRFPPDEDTKMTNSPKHDEKYSIRKYKSDEAYSQVSNVDTSMTSKGNSYGPNGLSNAPKANKNDNDYGGGFYHTLATQKNAVKSISTFYCQDARQAQQGRRDKRRTNGETTSSNSRSHTNSLEQYQNSYSKNGPNKGGRFEKNQRNVATVESSVEQVSSVGDNYYAAMVKMAKIRSVSQYNKQG